jgi:hypoxanthine phosphoribosyltransferase
MSREMTVLELIHWEGDADAGTINVKAMVEDVVEIKPWHWDGEAEFTHGLCKTTLLVDDLAEWPDTMEAQLAFLEDYDPDWQLVDEEGW